MKKTNKVAIGLGALGIMGLLSGSLAYAASDTSTSTAPPRGAHGQAIHEALAANDYEAFKKAIADAPRHDDAPEITEAMFAKMVEAEKLRQAGDLDGAHAIMKELGFKVGPHGDKDGHGTPPNLTDAQKTAWESARTLRQDGKFDEAKAVLKAAGIELPAPKMPANLSETQQEAWSQAHTLMQDGKRDEALAVLKAAGITPPQRGNKN